MAECILSVLITKTKGYTMDIFRVIDRSKKLKITDVMDSLCLLVEDSLELLNISEDYLCKVVDTTILGYWDNNKTDRYDSICTLNTLTTNSEGVVCVEVKFNEGNILFELEIK